jgi:hypothetical protein
LNINCHVTTFLIRKAFFSRWISISNKTPQTINERTLGVTALERSVAKKFDTDGLNQVLGCTNLTLASTGSHMNEQVQIVLVI